MPTCAGRWEVLLPGLGGGAEACVCMFTATGQVGRRGAGRK